MKIGIFSSGLENLSILNILKLYDLEIVLYMNQNVRPIEDKARDFQKIYIDESMKFFKEKKVDKIILPPVRELQYKDNKLVLPFFQNILQQTLQYSLVGRIGIIGNELDSIFLSDYIKELDYIPTEIQQKTKKFDGLNVFRKNVSIWNYNLPILSKRNWMIRKLIKTDLRYFLDCHVDSIIGSNYGIYYFDYLIAQKSKKMRFQSSKMWVLDNMFGLENKNNKYNIEFYGIGNTELFFNQKRRQILLG